MHIITSYTNILTTYLDLAVYMLLSLIQSDACNMMVPTVTMPHVMREQEKYACPPPPLDSVITMQNDSVDLQIVLLTENGYE